MASLLNKGLAYLKEGYRALTSKSGEQKVSSGQSGQDSDPPEKRGTFLRLTDLNLRNLEEILTEHSKSKTPLVEPGKETRLKVSGIFVEVPDAKRFLGTLEELPYATQRIQLYPINGSFTLEDKFKAYSDRFDGAMIFDENHTSSHTVFDSLLTVSLHTFMWKKINLHNPDGEAARQAREEIVQYIAKRLDFQKEDFHQNNNLENAMSIFLTTAKKYYSQYALPHTKIPIHRYEDVLSFVAPASFSFMGEQGEIQMGSKSKNAMAFALMFPESKVYMIKQTVYGPREKDPSTGTGKVVEVDYDPARQVFTHRDAYFILAKDDEYLKRYLPPGLFDLFDRKRHIVYDKHGFQIAAVVEEFSGELLPPGRLPRKKAYFLVLDKKTGNVCYDRADSSNEQRLWVPASVVSY